MQVTLNGEPRHVRDGISIAELIAELSLGARRLAVELNEEVLPRESYGERTLAPGDVIEIVHFIGGG
jgi:thiamine biosynthesis protein ThiS